MKIELRKIQHLSSMSEETNCYSADLYVDGALLAHVGNDGHGGCDRQRPAKGKTMRDVDALNALIRSTYPKQTYTANGEHHSYDTDLESVCGQLLDEHLIAKDVKRIVKSKVAWIDGDGKQWQVKIPKGVPAALSLAEFIQRVKEKNGISGLTLNEMTIDEAVEALKRAA